MLCVYVISVHRQGQRSTGCWAHCHGWRELQ